MSLGWIAPVVLAGLCVLSVLWTFATTPGFHVRGKHMLLSGTIIGRHPAVCVTCGACSRLSCCSCVGGTKGLGLAIATRYARAGAKLSLVGRSLERLESAKAEIQVRNVNVASNPSNQELSGTY